MKDYRLNPDWYRTKYNLVSELVNWATSGDTTTRAERLAAARRYAQDLLAQIEMTLGDRQRGRRPDAELCDFIADDVRPNTKLLLAQIEVAEQEGVAERERQNGEGDEGGEVESSATAGAEPESTVETVLETAPNTSELNYSIARLYALAQASDLARKYLDIAVDKAEPNEWQALAHRIVRDPVLVDVAAPSIGSVEGFSAKLATAREQTGAEAQTGAQGLD